MNKLQRVAINGLKHSVKDFDEKNILVKGVKILEKMVLCSLPGMSPHRAQYAIAEEAGMKPATQTIYSCALGVAWGAFKFFSGDTLDDIVIFNIPELLGAPATFVKYWGLYTFTDASLRIAYAALSEKPLGTFLWEIGYLAKERVYNPVRSRFRENPRTYIDSLLGVKNRNF